jgi:hypothetical protein
MTISDVTRQHCKPRIRKAIQKKLRTIKHTNTPDNKITYHTERSPASTIFYSVKEQSDIRVISMNKKIVPLALILVVALSITATEGKPISVGVKTGDWIEYNVITTGTPPAAQDITWARIEILDFEGAAFHANFTVRYANGTISSSVRTFNFDEGQVQAWIIIPANLNPGDTFYDSSINSNVTIQGQLQKTVAGATRTITYTNTTDRNKEWDKATGVYVQSVDNLGNYTINASTTATSMWIPQILGLDQNVFYTAVVAVITVVVVVVSAIALARRKRT